MSRYLRVPLWDLEKQPVRYALEAEMWMEAEIEARRDVEERESG